MKYNRTIIVLMLLLTITISGCEKYLNERQDKSSVIPRNVKEMQGLLDNVSIYSNYPICGELASDLYFFKATDYNSGPSQEVRRNYTWDAETQPTFTWDMGYSRVFVCNTVLDVMSTLNDPKSTVAQRNNVIGNALFYRSSTFYELVQIYTPPYSAETKNSLLGLPLRLKPDIEAPTARSTVEETYQQMITDLKRSVPLLPETITYKTRASKPAAYALLARIYFSMNDYSTAGRYADSCLRLYSALLDFNNVSMVNTASNAPFKLLNDEVIFHASTFGITDHVRRRMDTLLYMEYSDDDLRKRAYFRSNGDNTFRFKGNYNGTTGSTYFAGIATDEIFLLRAECRARTGHVSDAMADLNTLLETRWVTDTYIPYSASTEKEALNLILMERKKELLCRAGVRWSDLRRLNLIDSSPVSLKRIIDGKEYTLPPNSNRYMFLIPQSVIDITGISQNPR